MQLNQEVRSALYALRYEDLLIYLSLNTAISNASHFGGIIAFDRALEKLSNDFDRDDLQWGLDLMDKHVHLRSKWLASISMLDRESLPLYLERVEELWEPLTALPDVTTDIAWETLMSNLNADPGTRRSEANAFFKVNATVLAIFRKGRSAAYPTSAVMGVTEMNRHTSIMLPEGAKIESLNGPMTDIVVSHAADHEALIHLIRGEGIVHPSAINYRLEGVLPEVRYKSDELANEMLVRLVGEARDGSLAISAIETAGRIHIVEKARSEWNEDFLTLCLNHMTGEDASFFTLERMSNDFKKYEQSSLLRNVTSEGILRYVSQLSKTPNISRPNKDMGMLSHGSIRVAVTIGSPAIVAYIERDASAVINAMSDRGIKDFSGLMQFLEQATSSGQTPLLADGTL